MVDRHSGDIDPNDALQMSENMARVAARSQKVVSEFVKRRSESGGGSGPDPLNLAGAFMQATAKMMADAPGAMQAYFQLWQTQAKLWDNVTRRSLGSADPPLAEVRRGDKRFKDPAWEENPLFDFVKQSYLLTAQWLQQRIGEIEGLDEQTAKKVSFYTQQFVDAMAPSNFVLTNPEVLRATVESKGENLVKGLENLLDDLERSDGELMVKMTDLETFVVGKNVAVTPGQVIFQNDLIQLIQYNPTTETVYQRPLMIVPPWINKFYILDLRPDNSFIRWSLDQGYTVFVLSWVNPDARLIDKTFADYIFEGPLAALDAIEQATGVREVSAIGYCIGGTLMAATLAYMAAKGDDRIKACTFFAAQVDFSEPGELSVFIDEEQLQYLEKRMDERGGLLDASAMASSFNMLRANDLIWSFVVNNYLLGRQPLPFDLLFWNSDATRIPAGLHSYYLRNMYQKNRLVQPGALSVHDVPIDLTKIETPVYLQASKEDHIAPFPSVFKATHHYRGPVRFMLAGSGHIAGVVNPPAAKKYQYWINDGAKKGGSLEEWQAGAVEHPGSWWPDWDVWLSQLSGPRVAARTPGDGKLEPIEPAPGSYVTVKS